MNRFGYGGATLLTGLSVLVGCGSSGTPQPAPTTVEIRGDFTPSASATNAFSYDPTLVPPGASATMQIQINPHDTQVRLTLSGMVPNHSYGAHLHVNPCTARPGDAGGHFEHQPDPDATEASSTDPLYANPHNEVWLDFTPDAKGSATVATRVPWRFDPDDRPNSLVVHAGPTKTSAGVAGTAGSRVGCLTLQY